MTHTLGRACAHIGCGRHVEVHGCCRLHYRRALDAGIRAALGDLLSPSLHPLRVNH